jgi:hypothetical protein
MVVVIALFSVYALCAVFLCIIGADIYRSTADSMRQNYDDRTSVLYVVEKIRQNDSRGSIKIGDAYGSDALVLTERESGRDYQIWMFVKDGTLYEGVFAPGTTPDVAICQKIMPMSSMAISVDASNKQMMDIEFTSIDGQTQTIDVSARSTSIGGA